MEVGAICAVFGYTLESGRDVAEMFAKWDPRRARRGRRVFNLFVSLWLYNREWGRRGAADMAVR